MAKNQSLNIVTIIKIGILQLNLKQKMLEKMLVYSILLPFQNIILKEKKLIVSYKKFVQQILKMKLEKLPIHKC